MFNQANNTTFTGVANAVAGDQINHNTYNHSGADTGTKQVNIPLCSTLMLRCNL
jgi:hypothetical protein